jgi:hypothetical protein
MSRSCLIAGGILEYHIPIAPPSSSPTPPPRDHAGPGGIGPVDVHRWVSAQGTLRDEIAFDELVRSRVDEPWDDEPAPASYRREVAGVVARRALEQTEDGDA